jgi:hypothetical protein
MFPRSAATISLSQSLCSEPLQFLPTGVAGTAGSLRSERKGTRERGVSDPPIGRVGQAASQRGGSLTPPLAPAATLRASASRHKSPRNHYEDRVIVAVLTDCRRRADRHLSHRPLCRPDGANRIAHQTVC